MKRTKSIFAVILAIALVLVSGMVAFAADKGSITIDNAVKDQTYTIYRIFDLSEHAEDYSGVTYKVNPAWNAFFAEGAKGLDYVTIDSNGYVTWKTGADAAEFAQAAYSFAEANSVSSNGAKKATENVVKFDNLELGYYLVHSSLDSVCSLDTTKPDVTIKEKNSKPSLEKEVQEDSTGTYGKTNDGDIGDEVNFRITVKALDGDPKNYVIHDKMSSGLNFNESSVKVSVNGEVITTGYTLVTKGLTDDCTFEIKFDDNFIKTNDVIVVDYSATINENAVIGKEGNPNESHLSYGNESKSETIPSETHTYVWEFDVFKYTKEGNEKKGLKDVEFRLYKEVDGVKYYAVLKNSKLEKWTTNVSEATVIKSPDDGTFSIAGLDADTYYLEEIKTLPGYNKLAAPVKVVISASVDETTKIGTATVKYSYNGSNESIGTVEIENNKGAELPSTGGIGTTIFYIVGAVLVAAAGILLITKKRMSKAAD